MTYAFEGKVAEIDSNTEDEAYGGERAENDMGNKPLMQSPVARRIIFNVTETQVVNCCLPHQ